MVAADTIYEGFKQQMEAEPDKTAVFDETRTLSRRELDDLACRISSMLPKGVRRVGLIMEHGTALIASMLAVLRVGAAYIPAEPDFPLQRIRYMFTDAEVDCVLTQDNLRSKVSGFPAVSVDKQLPLLDKIDKDCHISKVTSEDLAYILYTSGSTGVPKGVAVRNRNVCHYVRAFQNEFHMLPSDVMLQYSVCTFDIFVEEVFTTLLLGGVLAIPAKETKQNMDKLLDFADRHQVSIISGFPYLLSTFNRLHRLPDSLRLLISGGDVLRASYIDWLLDRVTIYNTYGPSETTVCASYFCCNGTAPLPDGTYPIGKPVQGSSIMLVSEDNKPVPFGEIGEIRIGGGGVALGYIGNAGHRMSSDMTGSIEGTAFVSGENGETLYYSGDLGYFLPDGNLAFLRRKDQQVMIDGRRVEPDEVANVLYRLPDISQAYVGPYTDEAHRSYLIAYVVTNKESLRLSELKNEMSDYLPSYMIPEFFVRLKSLPYTPNGKIDSDALPVVLKEGDFYGK